MPNVLAASFEGPLAPSFELLCLQPGGNLPDGWGIAYYPGSEPSAAVLKEPAPSHGSMRSELVKAWEHLESSVLLLHIRTATWGAPSNANTQPFIRPWGRRHWVIGHSGSVTHRLDLDPDGRFEPVGSTDTEILFCHLLGRFASAGWRSLGEADLPTVQSWFDELNPHGSMSMVLTDGLDVCAYADRNGAGDLFVWEMLPPYGRLVFGDRDLRVDLARRGIKSRKGVLICSERLVPDIGEIPWRRLPPGNLLVVRQGAVRAELPAMGAPAVQSTGVVQTAGSEVVQINKEQVQRLRVVHRTTYRYDKAVERSTHLLRLTPVHDRRQSLLWHDLRISVDGKQNEFDDVFGNRVHRMLIEHPYTELIIEMQGLVEMLETDPLDFKPIRERSSIPLAWMPWQQAMLQPYLLPPELPESQLTELVEYAMSFVERNDYDLLTTLADINQSIFREYEYRQGETNLQTTPFEIYELRRGVCQDFTNLFICLARLLGVPARYVCGYLYTGPKHLNRAQAEASHAWLQVYLPGVGWRGFDPTNGVLTQTNHIRVAVGRNYLDATPTSGTIYVGGGKETLEVHVSVEPDDSQRAVAG